MAGPATHRSTGAPKKPPPKPAKTKAFQDPMTTPFKTTAGDRAVVKEIRRRQGQRTASEMAARTGAIAGLPTPGGFGMTGQAKDKYQVNLTAKADLAKANVERRQNGGLLTPKQAKREQAASKVVAGELPTTFKERHDLGQLARPAVHLTPPKAPAPPVSPRASHPPVPTPTPERGAQPAYGARGGVSGNPFIAKPSGSVDVVPWALGAADKLIATTVADRIGSVTDNLRAPGMVNEVLHGRRSISSLTGLPGAVAKDVVGSTLGLGQFRADDARRLLHGELPKVYTGEQAAGKIGSIGLTTPNVDVPGADLDPASQAALTKAGLKSVKASEMGAAGFTPEATQRYTAMALKRGWYKGELQTLNGLDLLERAYNDPPNIALRTGQNFVGGVARTGSAGAAIYGLAREHNKKALGQLAEAGGSWVGALAHPKEAIVSDPYGYLPLPGLALKGVGSVGYLMKAADKVGERTVRVGAGDVGRTVEGEAYPIQQNPLGMVGPQQPGYTGVIHRGTYSRNLATAAGQHLSDRAAELFGKNAAISKHVDTLVRRATNANGAAHQMAQLAYKKAQRKVGKKRAEILLALQHGGGDAEAMAKLYDAQALKHEKGAASPAAGAARFYRDVVAPATKKLSEDDLNFLAAHSLISEHTSNTLIKLGRFSPTAALYRRNEPLLLAAAERAISHGDAAALHGALPPDEAAALHILYLRKELDEHIPSDAPAGRRIDVRRGRTQESARAGRVVNKDHQAQLDILNDHAPPVMPKRHLDEEHDAAVEEWKQAEPQPPKKTKLSEEDAAAKLAQRKADWRAQRPKRPPMTDAERSELAKYRAEKADWDKNWAKKHADAKVKERAYRKAEGVSTRKNTELRSDQRIEERSIPDQADIRRQYHDALVDFERMHLEKGGMAPARVAYTKRETFPGVRRGAQGARNFVAKPGGTQAKSTGKSFLSGNYLIDSKSPILENLRAQRLETSIGSYHQIMAHLAVEAKKNDPVPDGMIFVKGSNAATLGKIEHEMESNPVAHGDHYASEHSIREDFTTALKAATQKGQHAGEDGFFVPAAAWRRMVEYTTPESSGRYQRFLRQYQRVLISTFPGTVIGNTLGSMPLAMASGAGYRSFRDAYHAMNDPTLAPASLRGRGVAGGLASEAHNVATHYMDFMRRQSVKGEDWSRLAGYFSKAGPHIRREAERLGMEADDYARAFAKGEIDPRKLDEFLNHAESFLGDTVKPNGKYGRMLGNVILFHNWVGHMAKLMLWTLPIKHPGTAVMVNTLASYGDQYRREHGVWPSWMTDYVPLPKALAGIGNDSVAKYVPGGMQQFTRALNIGQLMPQSTAGGLLSNVMADRPIQERLSAVVGPPLSQIAAFMQQATINRYGADSNQANLWKTAVNLALSMIPGERKAFPMQGRKPDDLSIFNDPSYKMYTSRVPGMPLSPFLQPGAVPDRGVSGFIERSLGGGVYSVPNQGPITDTANYKNTLRHVKDTYQGPRAELAKKRKEAIYKAMRERGVQDPAALLP